MDLESVKMSSWDQVERGDGEESCSQRTEASTLPRHRSFEGGLLRGWEWGCCS